MLLCSKCGEKNINGYKFCKKCDGSSFTMDQQSQDTSAVIKSRDRTTYGTAEQVIEPFRTGFEDSKGRQEYRHAGLCMDPVGEFYNWIAEIRNRAL